MLSLSHPTGPLFVTSKDMQVKEEKHGVPFNFIPSRGGFLQPISDIPSQRAGLYFSEALLAEGHSLESVSDRMMLLSLRRCLVNWFGF